MLCYKVIVAVFYFDFTTMNVCSVITCQYSFKFRPAPDNPYLHVPQDESDGEVEMEEV